jgi:hypothetical protein
MNRRPFDSRTGDAAAERWRLADKAAEAQAGGRGGVAALAAELDRPTATLRRWARVARRFPPRIRRSGLTFSHYEVLVGLADALRLADRAEREGWTVARTKAEAMLACQDDSRGPLTPPGGVLRQGPDVLDGAIRYLKAVSRTGGPGTAVQAQARELAALAQAVAEPGPAERRSW